MRSLVLGVLIALPGEVFGQCVPGQGMERDRSKPVPTKADILNAWRRRNGEAHSFQFAWTEDQLHPRGWIANPRYAERERLAAPALVEARYIVNKRIDVVRDSMRYTYAFDRRREGDTTGNGANRHYSYEYESVFDGTNQTTRVASLNDTPPTVMKAIGNRDAQNLDARAILMALRPLDPVLGDLLIDRAVPNLSRTFYRGRSVFLFEERRDPLGWKTILWLEPERDFLVSRFVVAFENTCMLEMDIDYGRDSSYGWVPTAWRVTETLADGSRRLISTAKVTSYAIH